MRTREKFCANLTKVRVGTPLLNDFFYDPVTYRCRPTCKKAIVPLIRGRACQIRTRRNFSGIMGQFIMHGYNRIKGVSRWIGTMMFY